MILLERMQAQSGWLFQIVPWLGTDGERTSPAHTGEAILVVDDNDQNRMITARMLRAEGYKVIEARSAEQALEQLSEAPEIQVVVTDIVMPGGMDGVELAERISQVTPWRRVVLISGYARLFPKLGTSPVPFPLLIKPFSAEQLGRQIRDVLRKETN